MPDIDSRIATIQTLLTEKFGVKHRPLARMLRKTGRRLPRRMRAHGRTLVEAQRLSAVPKMARMVDQAATTHAYDQLRVHLEAIDVKDRRKLALLRLGAAIAFNILVVGTAFVLWLWWFGYV